MRLFLTLALLLLSGQGLRAATGLCDSSSCWKKYSGNPVIDAGNPVEWDWIKSDPFVLKDGGVYKMWFGASDGNNTRIGYAESPDGINWQVRSSSVVDVGLPGSFDTKDVETPAVAKVGGIYHMWYSGRKSTGSASVTDDAFQIGHATSTDGINWTKDPQNPVRGVSASRHLRFVACGRFS